MPLTDAAYHDAFHAMCLALFAPTPTQIDVRAIVAFAERSGATAEDREVVARVLRNIYCCDGTEWDEHLAGHWFEGDGGVDVRALLAEVKS